jgi:hypothetical protein
MLSLKDIVLERLQERTKNPEALKQFYKQQSIENNKKRAFAVQCFQQRINKDRKKEGKPEVTFMAVRMKLIALYEINDLRWYYICCLKYARTKDLTGKRNTFSKCFYGGLKLK